ncbi:hypothetical protein CDV31_017172 [Fusarium ambrosium]|uniref:Secreted protein n=1 Tax=Fusarium ambrosium TaxID=131363 RepID=A0A428RQH6_9HYPO|nr:hypothetical protein CDV31_017172 [Fusarium ambrosium]
MRVATTLLVSAWLLFSYLCSRRWALPVCLSVEIEWAHRRFGNSGLLQQSRSTPRTACQLQGESNTPANTYVM